jgi:integrase
MQSSDPAAGVKVVRKRLADGTIKTYTYARSAGKKPTVPAAADTLGALLTAYQRSPEWDALSPRTKAIRLNSYRHLATSEAAPVSEIRRRNMLLLRDSVAQGVGPGAANDFTDAVGALFSWAIDREWIEHSPATRMKALEIGTYPTWTEDEFAIALTKFREPLRRAIILAIYTGQRRGDLIALRWTDVAGDVIRLVQQKTGAVLALPVQPALREEFADWRPEDNAGTVLVNSAGAAWTPSGLSSAMAVEVSRHKLPPQLSLHGLRKLAAVRLAQAGCSVHEIAAWTGHKSLKEIERYTAAASQERLAGSGLARLTVSRMTTDGNRKNTE